MPKKSEAGKTSKAEGKQHVIVTPQLVVVELNERQQQQVHECMKKSGKVTFSMKEISVTSLPETLAHEGVVIID